MKPSYLNVCVDCGLTREVTDKNPFPEGCRPVTVERNEIKYGADGRISELRAIPYLKGPRKP